MQTIHIQASDNLFFRDAKPFELSEESWASSLFPNISPGTFLGAIRTAFGAQNNLDVTKIKDSTLTATIKSFGITVGNDLSDDIYPTFSMPCDLVGNGGKTKGLQIVDNTFSSNPFKKVLLNNQSEKTEDLDTFRMSLEDFQAYLNGTKVFSYDKNNSLYNLNDFCIIEPKIGIGRDKSRNVTKESALYRVGMNRMEGKKGKLHFFATLNNIVLEKDGILKLGGENKTALYQEGTLIDVDFPIFDETTFVFKLYLFTPAIFQNGSIPDFINPQSYEGKINGVEVELLTSAIGRFVSYGGFDLYNNSPKVLYKAVPSGSVYYFALKNKNQPQKQIEQLIHFFNSEKNSISTERKNEGFGIVYVANI
ncbi:type III-B CRISPR module-associated protein Cmr3 [Flectobacillus roseus]|uniref:type III-B CRISPR module-associated protein Cmr3 n=1 Tax=Flectobacillus roseus TaxID=502259 RepID=UPI0024B83161|nr:type III-B CRISPR module-associated protein Cmr3 [Flectobacillus roseus]MDI9870615.1 type III-B CRISPR module-associated protein Cmr3 [Flectobacillus roseus]